MLTIISYKLLLNELNNTMYQPLSIESKENHRITLCLRWNLLVMNDYSTLETSKHHAIQEDPQPIDLDLISNPLVSPFRKLPL